jgi:hypothetical protein
MLDNLGYRNTLSICDIYLSSTTYIRLREKKINYPSLVRCLSCYVIRAFWAVLTVDNITMHLKQRNSQTSFCSAIHSSSTTCEHILHTKMLRLKQQVRFETSKVSRISRRSDTVYLWSTVHANRRKCCCSLNCNTLEPDRPQHDRPAACVIAQQYSVATRPIMLSLQHGKIRRAFKKCYDFIFQTFQNSVHLKLRNVILRKLESVCISYA